MTRRAVPAGDALRGVPGGSAGGRAIAQDDGAGTRPDGRPPLEVWAGIECTVNRVGDRWLDQIARSGLDARLADLDALAALGIRALRVPLLWEHVVREAGPAGLARADWSHTDRRLARLRALGVRPIATLVHHGSGPAGTHLLDPAFPAHLAAFARAAAERYPWIGDWTPVNEPLTTARFAALYGLWYPHARDDASFAAALLHELRGTVLAMRAIREVVPDARLVQTEDLGKTHATPALAYQAALENERRWLTVDLLAGRLSPDDVMWQYLVRHAGVAPAALDAFRADPCPPDVAGYNHYLTSERFLDRRLARYPEATHGGNGRDRYADVEAVRVLAEGPDGPERLLLEAWHRHGLPLALTEVHLGCTREQQARWLVHAYRSAERARVRGADVRAVTAWSALGAYDWNSLLTVEAGHYEPGVLDVRGAASAGGARPTLLATVLRDLATAGESAHPALDGPGWWQVPERLLYPTARRRRACDTDRLLDRRHGAPRVTPLRAPRPETPAARAADVAPRPVLIVGARGTLARALVAACRERGLAHVAVGRPTLDAADAASVDAALDAHRPWAVVSTAGYVRVDEAEAERDACWRDNVCAAATLARACATRGIPFATYSTDLVFDGAARGRLYVEDDAPNALNAYGASKAEAERLVAELHPGALSLRTAAFFGPVDEWNFLTLALRELAAGREFRALADVHVSPTYVPALADATLDLVCDGAAGLWHLANAVEADAAPSWYDFARLGAARAGLDPDGIVPTSLAAERLPARRPHWAVLGSARGQLLPALDAALDAYCRARGLEPRRAADAPRAIPTHDDTHAAAHDPHAPHDDGPPDAPHHRPSDPDAHADASPTRRCTPSAPTPRTP